MDDNLFRDYCKAENSEDEEANYDLQSRLYAEIYYGPSDIERMDTKPNIKLETFSTDDETLRKNESTVTAPNSNDNLEKDSYSVGSSRIVENDNKSDVKHIIAVNQSEPLHGTIDKNNSSVLSMNAAEHSVGNAASVKNNVQSMMCQNMEGIKSSLYQPSTPKTGRNITEPKREPENEEQLNTSQYSIPETPRTETSNDSITGKLEVACTETELNENYDDILKKYQFSKLFINKLYLEKYAELEIKLQKMEEEKERCLREAERRKNEENEQEQQWSNCANIIDETDADSRYNIFVTNKKAEVSNSEEIILSSETESNSEDSILEVPIPPKPKPPIINLNDSDESSESSSNSDSDDEEYPSIIVDSLKNSDINMTSEDIMINCTEVQKCASNINEIKKASKSAQLESSSNKTQSAINVDENTHDFHLPSKTTVDSNIVYERDKNKSVGVAENIGSSNCLNSNESTSNKKRHRENDNEPCSSAEQGESVCNENKRSKISIEKHTNHGKNKQQTWEEYFFHPMSESVKSFYNESRGQENFDIREIQNKMSKDPRLWTILDEDLMPGFVKHRYWNLKCKYCHYRGHQRHNCPELSKTPRCHMCGSEGHTETRCPEKMCLTCGKKQGTFRKTCESCRTLYCNMCKAVGHKSTECPDLWRRFHQTTRNSEINIPKNLSEVMKPADLLYCCNCTKRGHDSSTCNEYRWSQHFPTPAFVSNYTDGPEYEKSAPAVSSKSEDIIPLTNNAKKHKHRTFLQGQDNLEGCFVVYSYGTFYTKEPNGEEVKKNLHGDHIQASQLTNFLKGRVPPFLDQLKKLVKFEIKIYYNPQRVLMMRVRSVADIAPRICDIFLFWLKLSDEDKHLDIQIDFPHSKRKMVKFLTTKFEELLKDLDDPNYLCDQIEQLKTTMSTIQDRQEIASISKKILDLRAKLLKVFHVKPKRSNQLKKIRKIIKLLNRNMGSDVSMISYLNIIISYNKIFVPRTLTKSELNQFLKNYYKPTEKAKKKNTGKENEESKKEKKNKLGPYEIFLQNLRKYNNSKAEANACHAKNTEAMLLTKPSEKQSKQTSTVTSATTETPTVDNTVQCVVTDTEVNAENTYVESSNMETNVDETNIVYPIECVPLSCDRGETNKIEVITTKDSTISSTLIPLPSEGEVITATKKTNSKQSARDESNLIIIPLKTTERLPKKQSKKKESSNMPCPETKPPQDNIEKPSEIISDNSTVVETSDSQQQNDSVTSEASVTKKKKSKKAKKAKPDCESSSQLAEDQATDPNTILVNKANAVIDEALGFNLPYMNKAVKEVQNRISDGRLKQEHINVLQRLINLEKDHQKYVSSFCNYLQ